MLALTALIAGTILCGCNADSGSKELEAENTALIKENTELQAEIKASEQKIAGLETDIIDILEGDESQLRNPAWEELKRFIETDKTDTLEYIPDEFDCEGFTITLRDHAWRRGFRSGYVALGLGENVSGHTLNAFQTTDKGLVYIDNSEHDTLAYVKSGEVYGTIAFDGVKETFIDCSMPPEEFWKPIARSHYSGSLFDYAYYENYAEREEFYSQSIAAYNEEVGDYNSAVNAFHRGAGSYSKKELEEWDARLDSWSDNLDELVKDLGSFRLEPMGTVRSVEIYWN